VANSPALALVLTVLEKSHDGLTTRALKLQTPTISGKARSNALQRLKAAKQIKRAGKAWVAAA